MEISNLIENDDGSMDFIAYDYNQDGEWDKYEEVG